MIMKEDFAAVVGVLYEDDYDDGEKEEKTRR